ncbi:ABC transporter permease [Arthrobacter castelli]|uniref:ABC transporter permease n=1 Tax=Arthrobacter castelli TaxID=271431 RepID=UPI000562D61B|nr:ABC transporter permease [Arthrobacter castelli]
MTARLVAAARWLLFKALGAVFVLWAVTTLIFFGIRMIPGDPAEAILGGPGSQASAEALAQVRADYGLDEPLLVQYFMQLGRLLQGDLGDSYSMQVPVSSLLAEQLPPTLVLAFLALVLAWVVALALASWSMLSGRGAAVISSGLEIAGAAVPHFWLATVLIVVFSVNLGWLPPVNTGGVDGLVLPVVTLALPLAGFLGQVMRESMLNAATSPFALSARFRGETERGVLFRHSLRHAAIPGIALSGWAFGSLISGAVVVETIFARPGLGRTLLRAVTDRDIPLVTGVALVAALAYVVVMALSDIAERLADPRVAKR